MVLQSVSRLLESRFEHCSDHCGWIAAIVAALSYGTFGVPIKETVSVDVHPLVLQSYKTCTMFVFSWFIVYMGEAIRFTPWGLLSGLLWVCGGTGGIYGIRNAGMSVATGTWSSCMVIINFLVGILLFQEPVASVAGTFGAFVFLGIGLVGMSVYSAPNVQQTAEAMGPPDTPLMSSKNEEDTMTSHDYLKDQETQTKSSVTLELTSSNQFTSQFGLARTRSNEGLNVAVADTSGLAYNPLRDQNDPANNSKSDHDKKNRNMLLRVVSSIGIGLTKRQLGIGGAVINGILTGSSLVPIHYAKQQGFGGAAYMLSFATGALLANVVIFTIWFMVNLMFSQRDSNGMVDFTQAYKAMPPWHFRQLWAPGFAAGTLLSIAMFGSILSVTYLGQGVGNSIIQCKILIRYVAKWTAVQAKSVCSCFLHVVWKWPMGNLLVPGDYRWSVDCKVVCISSSGYLWHFVAQL
jgi:Transmembrane family, TMEM144 of transporters